MAKTKKKATTALAIRQHDDKAPASNQALAMIERFATNPDFNVEKMKALMEMREREMSRVAEQAFNAAMAKAQRDMRPVARDADNPSTRSRYATYTAIDNALRPIYAAYDFGLSFNTGDAPVVEMVRVLCDVSHAGGFSRQYHIDMPADGKGAKGGDVMTKTHATGSAVSYGMRYLLKMIFNVAIGEFDDDGNRAGKGKPSRKDEAPIDAVTVSSQPESAEVITLQQRDRLAKIAEKMGRKPARVSAWLLSRYGVKSSKDLLRRDYQSACEALEARGELPMPGDGQ